MDKDGLLRFKGRVYVSANYEIKKWCWVKHIEHPISPTPKFGRCTRP